MTYPIQRQSDQYTWRFSRRLTAAEIVDDTLDRLGREFSDYATERGLSNPYDAAAAPGTGRGAVGYWPNIENFLKDNYPASHRGLTYGFEDADYLIKMEEGDHPPQWLPVALQGKDPYETGPDAIATHGYDPKEVAATMLLLHNESHPGRTSVVAHDRDFLLDLVQKRMKMQRDYEQRGIAPGNDSFGQFVDQIGPELDKLTEPQRQPVTAQRQVTAMAWDEWAPKIQHFKPSDKGKGYYSVDHGDFTSDLSYTPDHKNKTIDIGLLAVNRRVQGDGIAEALVRRMVQDHPGYRINTGYMTDEGRGFRDHMLEREPTARDLVAQRLAMAWQDWKDHVQTLNDGKTGVYYINHGTDGSSQDSQLAFTVRPNRIDIHGLYTNPAYRKDGIAEAFFRRLHDEYPGLKINPGSMTPDGQAFHDKMLDKEPDSRQIVTAAEDDGDPVDLYHVTTTGALEKILREGIVPQIGSRSRALGEAAPASYHFLSPEGVTDGLGNWLGEEFEDEPDDLHILHLQVPRSWVTTSPSTFEGTVGRTIPPQMIKSVHTDDGSGSFTRQALVRSRPDGRDPRLKTRIPHLPLDGPLSDHPATQRFQEYLDAGLADPDPSEALKEYLSIWQPDDRIHYEELQRYIGDTPTETYPYGPTGRRPIPTLPYEPYAEVTYPPGYEREYDDPRPGKYYASTVNESLIERLARFDPMKVTNRLRNEFYDWFDNLSDDRLHEIRNIELHPFMDHHEDNPVGHWPTVERFLKDKYPAAHRGFMSGHEDASMWLDNPNNEYEDPMLEGDDEFGSLGPPEPYSSEDHQKLGYDPQEVAAGMVLLHNRAHPGRQDSYLNTDKKRLVDIFQKRQQMQRDYEQRTAATRDDGSCAGGDCYESALNYLRDHMTNPNIRLVHGEVEGQGSLEGVTFGHAWVEDGDTVIDRANGRDIRMPKQMYYDIGGIGRLNNYHSYKPSQALRRALDTGHYGPWDLVGRDVRWMDSPQWEGEAEDTVKTAMRLTAATPVTVYHGTSPDKAQAILDGQSWLPGNGGWFTSEYDRARAYGPSVIALDLPPHRVPARQPEFYLPRQTRILRKGPFRLAEPKETTDV